MKKEIVVNPLARIEGHAAIRVEIEENKLKTIRIEMLEGPRFIEKLLVGRSYEEAPDITSRICGVCPDPYMVAASIAIEKAVGVKVNKQITRLRHLQLIGNLIQSHALHLYLLALPDYLGYPDALSMKDKYEKELKTAFLLKKTGNMIKEAIVGRAVHGVTAKPGGYTHVPSNDQLEKLAKQLEKAIEHAEYTIELFSNLETREYPRTENLYMALDPGDTYGFMGDHVLVSNGERHPVENYRNLTNEKTIPYSTCKYSYYKNNSFMVGALARILLNKDKIEGRTKELLEKTEEKLDPQNPLTNNLAQALEVLIGIEKALKLIKEILDDGDNYEHLIPIEPRNGVGTAAVEAPRGILYHYYELDDKGRIVKADIISPTAQNAANIEKYLRLTTQWLLEQNKQEIEPMLEKLVRAYDPCISCSTHLIRVIRK